MSLSPKAAALFSSVPFTSLPTSASATSVPILIHSSTPKGVAGNRLRGLCCMLVKRFLSVAFTLLLLFAIWRTCQWGLRMDSNAEGRTRPQPTPNYINEAMVGEDSSTLIIIVTPTHRRPERLADMVRFSQTLMHIRNLNWIVIEDANQTVEAVDRLLQRSKIPYVYFYTTTMPGFPKRGWTHRNMGLEYIRKHYRDYKGNAVVYFADDDNSYDLRLFDEYIRRVKKIGVWAVGLAGSALVEAPHVAGNGTIVSWDVVYAPARKFAVDMAGFAVNLKLILSTNATFSLACAKVSPESCFLAQFGVPRWEAEPFGYKPNGQKDVLVWHTKTKSSIIKGDSHGYVVER